jgi:hypothetical protein
MTPHASFMGAAKLWLDATRASLEGLTSDEVDDHVRASLRLHGEELLLAGYQATLGMASACAGGSKRLSDAYEMCRARLREITKGGIRRAKP